MTTQLASRASGPATEIVVYAYVDKVGRHWKRDPVRNVTVSSDPCYTFDGLPAGRYRLEYVDEKGWFCHVEVWVYDETGLYQIPSGAHRQRARLLPPPEHLPGPDKFPKPPPKRQPKKPRRGGR